MAALALALLLGLSATLRGWADLAALRLPDTDDMMRLQQIRDWIHGQAFGDLAQHRLGPPPGLEMHWSRLPDLAPAAIIVMLAPVLGMHGAEIAAVAIWPVVLFAAALLLVAGIARALGVSGALAATIGALAYPATTLFLPGRIDHHGLQLVLLLVVVRSLVGAGSLAGGAAAGVAITASLAIGLETALLLAIAASAAMLSWITGGKQAQARLCGLAAALILSLAAAAAVLRTSGWEYPACDGFTRESWRAAQAGALALGALALASFVVSGARGRAAAAVGAGGAGLTAALLLSPGCLHPYGAVDPLLARIWLANVEEAQPLLAAPLADAVGYAGLMFAGVLAAAAAWKRENGHRWAILLAMQLGALALTLAQIRGAYAGAMLAAPALAALIVQARRHGTVSVVGAWLGSAGLVYPFAAAHAFAGPAVTEAAPGCDRAALLAALGQLPAGTLLSSIDLGAGTIAATPHRALAGPYHRNTVGNRAVYVIFLGDASRAQEAARALRIDYLALCPGDLAEAGVARRASFAAALRGGTSPRWLAPVPVKGGALLFRVVR
ncbi:hypothetical protein ACMGDH_06100 [Sphingomonas sp. DT-207]